ncbi:MAG: hypothetical protein ACTSR8_01745 [Promethearchaeota archaeon]
MKFPTTRLNELIDTNTPIEGIISVWGDFGVGKTTFALQSAINNAELQKSVIYIYSKPNFPSEKVYRLLQVNNEQMAKEILDNIIFIQSLDLNDLNTIIFNLEFLILNNIKNRDKIIDLIIIDSITDLYRIELDRFDKDRNVKLNLQLNQILANLFYINETYSIEVLLTNEVSRKEEEGSSHEVQSGGKVMDYWTKYVLKISRTEELNKRLIYFSRSPDEDKIEIIANLKENGFE